MINLAILAAAFGAGFFGSVHCIGMCGGIVGILSSNLASATGASRRLQFLLAYNSGRILSYAIAGAIAGFIGFRTFSLFSPQRAHSVGIFLAGVFMIALGLYIAGWWRGLNILERGGQVIWRSIEPIGRRFLAVKKLPHALFLGVVWGWLPCGLVYATLAWSLTVGGAANGAMLMIAFGLGTLPMLLLMGTAAEKILAFRDHPYLRQIFGVLILLFGVLTFTGIISPIHLGSSGDAGQCIAPQMH